MLRRFLLILIPLFVVGLLLLLLSYQKMQSSLGGQSPSSVEDNTRVYPGLPTPEAPQDVASDDASSDPLNCDAIRTTCKTHCTDDTQSQICLDDCEKGFVFCSQAPTPTAIAPLPGQP